MLRGEIQPQLLESLPGVGRRLSWGSAVPTRWQQRAPTKEPGELCQRARVMVSKPGPGLEGIPLRDFEKSQIPDPSPLLYSIVPIPVPEPYLAVALDGRGGQPGRKDKEREGRMAVMPIFLSACSLTGCQLVCGCPSQRNKDWARWFPIPCLQVRQTRVRVPTAPLTSSGTLGKPSSSKSVSSTVQRQRNPCAM